MNNPFKSKENESKSSSTNTLSPMAFKPIKSLSSNATGSGKTKVELKPGHSLMDWIRLTNSGEDLTYGSFGTRRVTGTELAQHNKLDDAWTSIQGNVFNITQYLNFHPGGVDELMRAAGKESTLLFKQIHAWVNWNSMLQKCKIGHLIPGDDVQFAELNKKEDVKKDVEQKKLEIVNLPTALSNEIFDKNFVVLNETDSLYDLNIKDKKYHFNEPNSNLNENQLVNIELSSAYWCESMNEFYLYFEFDKDGIEKENLMIDLTEDKSVKVKIYLFDKVCYMFSCLLPDMVKKEIKFNFENTKVLNIILVKLREELWAGQINSDSYEFELMNQRISNAFFRKVKLIEKKSLTHDAKQFTYRLPDALYMPIKYGNHVAFRLKVNGNQIFRYYTVIPQYFTDQDETSEIYEIKDKICFIIKIYEDGEFTSQLDKLKVGDQIEMSDTFSIDIDLMKILENKDRKTIYLLAGGTGITPMLSVLVLNRLLARKEQELLSDREIKLIFCNKTEDDIILRNKLEQLIEQNQMNFKFSLINILSRPSSNWNGLKGRINDELIKQFVKFDQNEFMFLCGPDGFLESILKVLDSIYHLTDDSYYIFSG